jgi:hypothetical protein
MDSETFVFQAKKWLVALKEDNFFFGGGGILVSCVCKNEGFAIAIMLHLMKAATLALCLLPMLFKSFWLGDYFYFHNENNSFIFYVL